MKKRVFSYIKAIIALIILFLVLRTIDFAKVSNILSSVELSYVITAGILVILLLFVKSVRWNLIINQFNDRLTIGESFSIYMSSYSVGVVTPGRLGEFIKVYNLRHSTNLSPLNSFLTVIADRVYDLVTLFVFGTAGLIVYLLHLPFSPLIYLSLVIFVFVIAFVVNYIFLVISKASKLKWVSFLNELSRIVFNIRRYREWTITIFAYAIYFLAAWLLFLGITNNITYFETVFIMATLSLVLLLPITIAGFGTREYSLIILLGMFNIPSEVAISFSILQLSVFFGFGGLVGLIFFLKNPVPLSEVKNDMVNLKGLVVKWK